VLPILAHDVYACLELPHLAAPTLAPHPLLTSRFPQEDEWAEMYDESGEEECTQGKGAHILSRRTQPKRLNRLLALE
jgi:hypothetical protein